MLPPRRDPSLMATVRPMPTPDSTTPPGPDGPAAPTTPTGERVPAMEFVGVGVVIDGAVILAGIDLTIGSDDHWVVLGPNGGGKSTLLRLAALQQHPTTGTLRLLGHELGRVDVRPLRSRIGISSAGSAERIRGELEADVVVRCGRYGAFEPWWHHYDDHDHERSVHLLDLVGLGGFEGRRFGSLSSGERQRVLLARALMPEPAILLLDEPTAGLDFAGREQLVASLSAVAADPAGPATVLVVHHAEDIPPGTTHVLGLGANGVIAQGPIDEVLSSAMLSELFGLEVELRRHGGRYSAAARAASSRSETSLSRW